ncbi:hypothetical protein ACFL59_08245 [Planctomycetota bacterium]
MCTQRVWATFVVVVVLLLASAANAEDRPLAPATDGEAPAPTLLCPPQEVAVYAGSLGFEGGDFEVHILADGTATATYEVLSGGAADEQEPVRYTGRWRSAPFAIRLETDTSAGAARKPVHSQIELRGRTEKGSAFIGERRFRVGSWAPVLSIKRIAGGSVEPRQPAPGQSLLTGAEAAYSVSVDQLYLSTHTGRTLVSFRLRNVDERPVSALRLRFELREPKGKVREVRYATCCLALEPSEVLRVVDLDLGPVPDGLGRARARGLCVEARVARRAASPTRLGGQRMAELLEQVEIVFAWPAPDDRYEILVRNKGDTELRGVFLGLCYTDMSGRPLERLPIGLERPLAPGEVRYLHHARGTPRGAKGEPYYLHKLDRVFVEKERAYPAPPDEPQRLGGHASAIYDQLSIRHLNVSGDRVRPVFTFDAENSSPQSFRQIVFAIAGSDARRNVVALVHAPLRNPPDLGPGSSRHVRIEAEAIYGIPDAVLTWSVIPGGLELGDAGD